MYNNINITRCDCTTLAFKQNGEQYAKLFKCRSHVQNSSTYNKSVAIFYLYHYEGNNFAYKKYYLTCKQYSGGTTESIRLLDLTPGNKGIDLIYTEDGAEKTFYVKGSFTGAQIYLKIEYCNYPSFLELYNYESFNNSFTEDEINKAKYISGNVASENLDILIAKEANVATIKRTDNTCQLDIKFSTNMLDKSLNDTTICNVIYAPKEEFTFPILISDSTGYKTGRAVIYNGGNIKLFGITEESKVWIHTTYLI